MISKYHDTNILNKLISLFSHITYRYNVSTPDTTTINQGSYIMYDYRCICQNLYINPDSNMYGPVLLYNLNHTTLDYTINDNKIHVLNDIAFSNNTREVSTLKYDNRYDLISDMLTSAFIGLLSGDYSVANSKMQTAYSLLSMRMEVKRDDFTGGSRDLHIKHKQWR